MRGSTFDTLDPAIFGEEAVLNVASGQLRNTLIEVNAEGTATPALAESWESSGDAQVWVFRLRQGVEFHNGKSLSNEDVVKSLNHHRTFQSRSQAQAILEQVSEIDIDGDLIVFRLARLNADLPLLLSSPYLAICPTESGEVDWRSGIGTGPYVLGEFEPGVRAFTNRFANYWKEDAAHFDAIETFSINDPNDMLGRLQGKRLNYGRLRPVDAGRLLSADGLRHLTLQTRRYGTFAMRINVPPFDNINVRNALKFSFNRSDFINRTYSGLADIGNDNPIGQSYPFSATVEELPSNEFDPERARFLLDNAGLGRLEVDLSVSDAAFSGATEAANLFSETAALAGIRINVIEEQSDGYWSNVWMQKPFFASSWGGRVTEDEIFSTAYLSSADWNETGWSNSRFDNLIAIARAEIDPDRRREAYVEAQKIVTQEGGSIIPAFEMESFALSSAIDTGGLVGSTYPHDNYRNSEKWSFLDGGTGRTPQSCRFDEKWCRKQDRCISKSDDC
ncbi:MAG: ABC transporter substrate-binding protein [Pseudomonadota bacterium]